MPDTGFVHRLFPAAFRPLTVVDRSTVFRVHEHIGVTSVALVLHKGFQNLSDLGQKLDGPLAVLGLRRRFAAEVSRRLDLKQAVVDIHVCHTQRNDLGRTHAGMEEHVDEREIERPVLQKPFEELVSLRLRKRVGLRLLGTVPEECREWVALDQVVDGSRIAYHRAKRTVDDVANRFRFQTRIYEALPQVDEYSWFQVGEGKFSQHPFTLAIQIDHGAQDIPSEALPVVSLPRDADQRRLLLQNPFLVVLADRNRLCWCRFDGCQFRAEVGSVVAFREEVQIAIAGEDAGLHFRRDQVGDLLEFAPVLRRVAKAGALPRPPPVPDDVQSKEAVPIFADATGHGSGSSSMRG
ncbi:MAG TPA: hypothetical protein VMW17_19195 [Candidatus Binatia bacterium]|nr:hypothetical protein [Candidatus Binatia bacterium]